MIRFRFTLVVVAILSVLSSAHLTAQGKVYLVLGSDTAIWEGMNVDRFHDTYADALYTDPSQNAYKVMDPAFRSQLTDSYGQQMKFTWWMMAGNIFRYATNKNFPIPNIMTLYLMNRYHSESIRRFGDELTLHYHTFIWSDYDKDGIFWWNQAKDFSECRDDFDVTVAQYLLEEGTYPVSFRSGWHYMDNGWQRYLDELLPYSMHDDYPAIRKDTVEPTDNNYDWSKSSSEFVPFHPSADNYQLPGNLKGWNVRSKHIGSVNATMMNSMFSKAAAGVDQVACLWGHLPETDFLQNAQKIDSLAHAAATKYPSVTFRYCTAVEAMQRWLGSNDRTPPILQIEEVRTADNAKFVVRTNEPIFQAQPFLAVKDIYERYFHSAMVQSGDCEWRTIDQYPVALLAKVGVAVTDIVGNLQTGFIKYKPDDLYLDNRDSSYAEVAGTWSTTSSRAWGVDARTAVLGQADSAAVQWTPRLSQSDTYNILLQVPSLQNAAGNIRVSVYNRGQVALSTYYEKPLQTKDWVFVGTARLEADGAPSIVMSVRGENQSGKVVAADVVKLSPLIRERQLVIGSTSVDFGEVSEEDTARVSLSLQNLGTSVLTIASIRSKASLAFSLVALPIALQPMQSVSVPIGFFSATKGVATDTLFILSDDPSQSTAAIPVAAKVIGYYVVIDNEDGTKYKEFGSWNTSNAQAYGSSSRYAWITDGPGSYVRYSTKLMRPGLFDIQIIVPKTANASTKARYILSINAVPVDSSIIDQNANSGTWVTVLSHSFDSSVPIAVTVRDATPIPVSGVVLRADALRFILQQGTTEVEHDKQRDLPSEFLLQQNYPNPFNPVTKIVYAIPAECSVTLRVFDLLGREIAVLAEGLRRPGRYEVDFRAQNLTSGVYIYRLEAGGSLQVRKMILVK